MRSVINFFKDLFNTHLGPARWQSGYWSGFHGWLNIISDLLIWLAFTIISLILLDHVSKRKQVIKSPATYLLFGVFLLFCGFTHFLDAGMFWVPMYGINTLIRFLAALFSLLTLIFLIKILPVVTKQKTPMELEREIELRKQTELKLIEINKSLTSFASMASHDLQEPLRKINVYASQLSEAHNGIPSPEARELAQKILNTTERMQLMVKDLLNLATLTGDIIPTKVNVRTVIEHVLVDLDFKVKEKSALITVADIPPVLGNDNYLYQLLLNIISNAIKFTKQRPVLLISGEQQGNRVFLHVKDNGIGMEGKDISKIFEPFVRLNAKSEFEGSGIGLAISQKIVSILRGSIQVISKPGEGATFTIELPAAG